MSTNVRPDEHALTDSTLRRSGVRDISGVDEDGSTPPLPNARADILEYTPGGRPQTPMPDWQLQAGPPPGRVDRIHNARNLGLIGKNMFGIISRGETMRVSHVPASHPNKPITTNPGVSHADDAVIPTPRIGNAL